jgi:hypothetical protein
MTLHFAGPPSHAAVWIARMFPHRTTLAAEITTDLGMSRWPPGPDIPDKKLFGRIVEHALGLTHCAHPPYGRLLDSLPAAQAQRLLALAEYRPPMEGVDAAWPSWRHCGLLPHPAKLFSAAARLTVADDLLRALGPNNADSIDAARMLYQRHPDPLRQDKRPIWRTRPAFRHLWHTHLTGFHTGLRTYGPATAHLALLGGRRHADFLFGTTILELKTGRLDLPNQVNDLIDQLITYTLLAHHDGHPVTHAAVYATRYQRILRFPAQQFLEGLHSAPLDLAETAPHLANAIRTDQPATFSNHR